MPNGNEDHMSTGAPFDDEGFPLRAAFAFGPRDPETGLYAEAAASAPENLDTCPRDRTHLAHPGPCPRAASAHYQSPTEVAIDQTAVLVGIWQELEGINLSLRALLQFAAIIAADSPQSRPLSAKQAVARAAQDLASLRARQEPSDAR